LDPKPHQEVLFSYLEYDRELQGNGDGLSQEWGLTREADLARDDSLTLDRLADTKITLVTGIADPKPLAAYLEDAGAVYEHLRFNDHHSFTENELRQFRKKEIVLTTEKDYVRLRGEVENLYYLPIRHRFIDDGQKVLEDCLHNFIKSYS
jgi:tetraacyldisaccharide 4'-kinase